MRCNSVAQKGVNMQIALNTNVVAYINATKDQNLITDYLIKCAKLSKHAFVYFDDVDLVYVDKTIAADALVDPALTMQHLLDALQAAVTAKRRAVRR